MTRLYPASYNCKQDYKKNRLFDKSSSKSLFNSNFYNDE